MPQATSSLAGRAAATAEEANRAQSPLPEPPPTPPPAPAPDGGTPAPPTPGPPDAGAPSVAQPFGPPPVPGAPRGSSEAPREIGDLLPTGRITYMPIISSSFDDEDVVDSHPVRSSFDQQDRLDYHPVP